MKTFIETFNNLEKQYIDCIKIGFIAGIGATLVLISLWSMRYLRESEEAIFQQRAEFEAQAMASAERTCGGRIVEFGRTEDTYFVKCK